MNESGSAYAILIFYIVPFRYKLAKVNPVKGFYPTEFLDKVHPLIVEKRATVHVRLESVQKFPLIADMEIKDRKGASTNLAKIFKDLDPS